MAIARCEKCGKPVGTKHNYTSPVEPIGYPDTASICGLKHCDNVALIWLNEEERKAYKTGIRIFGVHTNATKVKVKN